MNIFKTKYDAESIGVNKLNTEILDEALLASIKKIEKECKQLNRTINIISTIPHIPTMDAMEHCEAIVDLSNIKVKLIKIYRAFAKWFMALPNRYQKLYVAYYIKNSYTLCEKIGSAHYKTRFLVPMNQSFMRCVNKKIKLSEADLIKIPLIYNSYNFICNKRALKSMGHKKATKSIWRNEYDDTRNEKCDS